MPVLLWDASALVKRYSVEAGSETVHEIFTVWSRPMVGTTIGYAETFSAVLRKRNRGYISAATFQEAKSLLRAEVVNDPRFGLLSLDDDAIFAGIGLMERYNINATDAGILALFLRYTRLVERACLLVVSDQRLRAAANAEALATLDPETVTPDLVAARLSQP